MAFWLAEKNIAEEAKKLIEEFHPHLLEARIAFLFSSKRKVSGDKIILGCAKRVSDEDKVLSNFDFKIILSAEDWQDLTPKQKTALLDHELSHCEAERVPKTETVGGRKKPIRDRFGRKLYTDELKVDDETGRPKWKLKPHDFENFHHIAERYGIDTASVIGGFFPPENREERPQSQEAINE